MPWPAPDTTPRAEHEPPPATARGGAAAREIVLPKWLSTDWPLAAVCVALHIAIAFAVSAFIGLLVSLIANGFGKGSLSGLVAGAWLPFAGLGADTLAGMLRDGEGMVWFSSNFMLSMTVGLTVLAWFIVRAALARVGRSKSFVLAFVAKVAVIGAIAWAILASIASIGDVNDELTDEGVEIVANVGSAEAGWGALLVLAVGGLMAVPRVLRRAGWFRHFEWLRPVRYGAAAWAVSILGLGVVTSLLALLSADSAREGLAGAVVAPVLVGNVGVAAQAVAVGASNSTVEGILFIAPGEADLTTHISLFQFDLPPDADSGAAPFWLWLAIVVVPAVIFAATWKWLDRARPVGGRHVLAGSLTLAAGFALTAWAGALLAPLHVFGYAVRSAEDFDVIVRGAVARPSVGATFGLSLLWGVIGALAASSLWARRHQIDIIGSFSSADAELH